MDSVGPVRLVKIVRLASTGQTSSSPSATGTLFGMLQTQAIRR